MLQHIRIADGFRSQSAEQLAATAAGIITGLTGNAAFPSPPVDLKTVQGTVQRDRGLTTAIVGNGWERTISGLPRGAWGQKIGPLCCFKEFAVRITAAP
jgi:hypothetical protein